MCSLPRPPRTRRKEGVSDLQWHRFLFRRHVQRILGWKERLAEGDPAGFSDAVNFLLRIKFFLDSDSKPDGEAARAGQSRCPPPKSTIRSQCSTTSSENRVQVMGECPSITNQEESFPHGLPGMSKRRRLRSNVSRMASRDILSEIATNLPRSVQANGNAQKPR